MKKNKTMLGISTYSLDNSTYQDNDKQIETLERNSKAADNQMLINKNRILQRQIQLLKQSKKTTQDELNAYRKVLLKNGNVHEILDLQHNQIFQMKTNLQILQSKYDNLLAKNGSGQQTEYAIKCKQLQNIIKLKQVQHQKQISGLKSKLMRLNAQQLIQNSRMSSQQSKYLVNNDKQKMTPIKNTRRLV